MSDVRSSEEGDVRTLLNGIARRWSLDSVVYDGRLVVRLADRTGIKFVPPPPTLAANGYEVRVLEAQEVAPPQKPRLFDVIFEQVIAYQAVEEPCVRDPDYLLGEGEEPGETIRVLARSRFLGSVDELPFFGPRKAYQIYTEDMIVEVIALEAPQIRIADDQEGPSTGIDRAADQR